MGKQDGTKRFRRGNETALANHEILGRLGIEIEKPESAESDASQIIERLAGAVKRLESEQKQYRADLKRAVAEGDRMLAKALR